MGVYLTEISEADLQNIIMDYGIDVVQIKRDYDIKAISVEEPHGRLMDKDHFGNYIYRKYAMSAYSRQMDRFLNELYTHAPTVIEAEGDE